MVGGSGDPRPRTRRVRAWSWKTTPVRSVPLHSRRDDALCAERTSRVPQPDRQTLHSRAAGLAAGVASGRRQGPHAPQDAISCGKGVAGARQVGTACGTIGKQREVCQISEWSCTHPNEHTVTGSLRLPCVLCYLPGLASTPSCVRTLVCCPAPCLFPSVEGLLALFVSACVAPSFTLTPPARTGLRHGRCQPPSRVLVLPSPQTSAADARIATACTAP